MLSNVEIVQYLKRHEFFGQLPTDDLMSIAQIAEEKHFLPNDTIMVEGTPGDSLFIMVSGKVRVHKFNTTIMELGAFESFGDMALFETESRLATVSAVNEVVCLQVEREAFQQLLLGHMGIALGVIRVLSKRLKRAASSVSTGT